MRPSQTAILVATVAFLAVLLALTIGDVINNGPTPLSVVSLVLVAFLAITILRALITHRPK